jgi:hypothetical protein
MQMNRVVLVDPSSEVQRLWQGAAVVRSEADVLAALKTEKSGLWIAHDPEAIAQKFRSQAMLQASAGIVQGSRINRQLLVMKALNAVRRMLLQSVFQRVVSVEGIRLLAEDILAEVMSDDDAQDRFIGAAVDQEDQVVILVRGNLELLVEPFSAFPIRPTYPKPDFGDVEVTDYGQTVRLGEYEAAVSAILYERDAAYRKRYKANLVECDDSWGGSLRRLRKQREVRLSDFPGLDAKTVSRLEKNEHTPQKETLAIICERLGVTAEEIPTY